MGNLLQRCMSCWKSAEALFWQVALAVATYVDDSVRKRLAGNATSESATNHEVVVVDKDSGSMQGHQIEAYLGKLVVGAQTFFEDQQPAILVHMATDKSHVGGLPLQSSFIGVGGSNVVAQCLPQAPPPPPPSCGRVVRILLVPFLG